MRVRFWGTRGSIATPGPGTNRYGGNTSCVEVVTNSGVRFVLDCGTGARPFGMDLMARAPKPVRATILLGHTHRSILPLQPCWFACSPEWWRHPLLSV